MSEIKQTTDYEQFKYMAGNRRIDFNHTAKIREDMKEDPSWFATDPICVNENMFIIDGQHRFEAAKALRLPIYYVVGDGMGLESARKKNTRQKQWTIQDYAQSYADSGRPDYIHFLRLVRQYTRLNYGIILAATSVDMSFDANRKFKNGEYKVENVDKAVEIIKTLDEIARLTGRRLNVSFVRVFIALLNNKDFELGLFMRNLEKSPERLIPQGLARDNYRTIEDVFNYYSKSPVRFY